MQYTHTYESPLGRLLLASDGEALTGLWFEDQRHFASTLDADHAEGLPAQFAEAERWLDEYFSGRQPDFTPRLRLVGTDFRRSVWAGLLRVPYGQTVTYGQLAAALGASPRAVGGAVARNPISIIVPCHRVLGANGALTGYAGGIWRKEKLLALEGAGEQAALPAKNGCLRP